LRLPCGRTNTRPSHNLNQSQNGSRRPFPFETFSSDTAFQGLREREIVRVLDTHGNLVASPFGAVEEALPLSDIGLQILRNQNDWWEISSTENGRLLTYNRRIISEGQVVFIVQVARSLAERDRVTDRASAPPCSLPAC